GVARLSPPQDPLEPTQRAARTRRIAPDRRRARRSGSALSQLARDRRPHAGRDAVPLDRHRRASADRDAGREARGAGSRLMDQPDLNQIDLIVRDMDVSIAFYRALGVEI